MKREESVDGDDGSFLSLHMDSQESFHGDIEYTRMMVVDLKRRKLITSSDISGNSSRN